MNQRIEKLAMQANSYHDNFFDLNYKELDVFLEKFAELIVRECAGIYEKIDNGNLHMGTDDYLEALHKTFRS